MKKDCSPVVLTGGSVVVPFAPEVGGAVTGAAPGGGVDGCTGAKVIDGI